jgi:hypothetical protein
MSTNLKAQLWLWETSPDSDGVARWMHGGTIELDRLLSLRSGEYQQVLWLAGDDNVMFVSTNRGVFMVDLESMQFQKIFETSIVTNQCIHPFKNRYAQGNCIHLRCKYTKSFVLFPIIGLLNTASPFVFLNLELIALFLDNSFSLSLGMTVYESKILNCDLLYSYLVK